MPKVPANKIPPGFEKNVFINCPFDDKYLPLFRAVKRVEMHLTRYLCNTCAASIGKAVSRLDFAPPLNGIRITDVQRGVGAFVPKPNAHA